MVRAREQYGLLIDFDWCTGCHACEVAGKMIRGLAYNEWCIKVGTGKRKVGDRVVLDFIPQPTELCNLCAPRTVQGQLPACVHHCPPQVIHFGTLSELEELRKSKPSQMLFTPRAARGESSARG